MRIKPEQKLRQCFLCNKKEEFSIVNKTSDLLEFCFNNLYRKESAKSMEIFENYKKLNEYFIFLPTKTQYCLDCLCSKYSEWNEVIEKTSSELLGLKKDFTDLKSFFLYKAKSDQLAHVFSIFLKNEDLFHASLLKENLSRSERHLTEEAWLLSIPIFIRGNFILEKYNGHGTSNQGLNNGPDFVFSSLNKKSTLGIEVSIIKQSYWYTNKGIKDLKKFFEIIKDSSPINFSDLMSRINETINRKAESLNRYEKTDKLILVLISESGKIPIEQIWLMEYMANIYAQLKGFFQCIIA